MRRGRIRIRNKMGFQIVTILIFTIILPSIFFFWFIVQRYSNDLLSAAISERENLLEAINKSISLHFDNVQELSMTIYYDTSTKNYIDGHAYTEMIAANKEWEFAGLYADEGISGTRADKRPEFQRMIRDCQNGKIDYIITKSVSRFARNTVECLEYTLS